MVEDVSLPRMLIGTNWFLGYCHSTSGKSRFMERVVTNRSSVADIIQVFLEAGIDAIMCPHTKTVVPDAIAEAQDRTGVECIVISTPAFTTTKRTPFDGFDLGEVEQVLDVEAAKNVRICMPHTSTTDKMVDKCTREVRQMAPICKMIRDRGMIPGLSTHIPETVIYADETDLDVGTYIQPFNLMGFLMQVEVDWIAKVIRKARRPVMTIKSMAAGQVRPFQALTFAWNAIRECDMVTVGTAAPEEAAELIEMSLTILDRRADPGELQATRSKATLLPQG